MRLCQTQCQSMMLMPSRPPSKFEEEFGLNSQKFICLFKIPAFFLEKLPHKLTYKRIAPKGSCLNGSVTTDYYNCF
ncbi:uncharacterized protein NEPG_01325 [Nematocida parisii ERTm1]|uniref:Uncharacterized protein n=1 Tax=Nematocida parisii (strain ERTm3) TaxID=935791 RepID=I3EG33_NEMP3|nr:uncharacterized protein NEPG_01325 [Nematocida parisii ERTm1]EIJ88180.1 hypothetical protein NEQG_01624 [Nematocida parisii ERTm3]EIJ93753.1 hypothetical protein NEPG_01325 [Nematocida parisii ERTm1]|eukprot:XP_013059153.1 hypothetical protein NEPG_01325 [Nematocida parisii ERTm1]